MKKFLVFAAVCALSVTAIVHADDPHVQQGTKVLFLDTYDQLQSYNGYQGVVFVRDAGNARTGQNGDPEVRAGYAIYVWDTQHDGSTKWRKVSKEETMRKIDALDTKALVNKTDLAVATTAINKKMDEYKEYYMTNAVMVARLIQEVADIQAAVDVETMTKLREENNRFKESFGMMTNITISTTSSFGELKTAVVGILQAATHAIDPNAQYQQKEQEAPPVVP